MAAAEEIGLEVSEVIDVQPEQPNYRSTISTIADAAPDALLLFSQAEDGGTMVKQAAEAGLSLNIIGSTEWLQEAYDFAFQAHDGQRRRSVPAGPSPSVDRDPRRGSGQRRERRHPGRQENPQGADRWRDGRPADFLEKMAARIRCRSPARPGWRTWRRIWPRRPLW